MKKKILGLFILLIALTGCSLIDETDPSSYSIDELDTIIDTDEDSTYTDSEIVQVLDDVTVSELLVDIDIDDYLYDGYSESDVIYLNETSESYTILTEGTYILSGDITDTVIVQVDDEVDVHLVLNNVNISSSDGPAILILSGDDIEISVMEDTKNTLSDENNRTEEFADYSGVIYSKSDLIVNGLGTLKIEANYNDGIVSKDDLVIVESTINIDSSDDAIIGKDSVLFSEAIIVINCEGDGIKTTNEEEKGYIYIASGDFSINAGDEGLNAINSLLIYDGLFNISAQGKGIKSETNVYIGGGTINIDSTDDAIDANNDLVLYGGTITIDTEDDALKATNNVTIDGGYIVVNSCYEGVEAQNITVNAGELYITSSDDGLNATSNSTNTVTINGGVVVVSSYGDSFDSNGSLYINGGTVILNGPTNYQGNGTFDVDGTLEINGGTILAAGSSTMAEVPSTSSEQISLNVFLNDYYDAGSTVSLSDPSGDVILSFTALNSFDHIVFSSSELDMSSTYIFSINDDVEVEFQFTSVVMGLNESGETSAESSTSSGRKH